MFYRLAFEHVLSFSDPADYQILKHWKDPSPIRDWRPLSLTYASDTPQGDVFGLHRMMIWKQALVDTFAPRAETTYQALPLSINNTTHYAIHITRSCDCLDPEQSRFKRFKNRNIGVEQYVLRADCVGDALLFTIPDDGYSAIFASEGFKAEVDAHQWTGLTFIPL